MDRNLRKRHLRVWLILGPILIAGTIAAIIYRPPSLPTHHAPVVSESDSTSQGLSESIDDR